MEEARLPNAPLPAPAPTDLKPASPSLHIQVEHVNVTLEQMRLTQSRLQDLETRLADMTGECAGILDRWARNDERHASAVIELHGRLSEWNDLERRLLNESASRIHQFERSLQHEWKAIQQKHEEPLQRLNEQAQRVTETCLTAIDSAVQGFGRAEARLAAIEQHLHQEFGDLSREVREAVAELRQSAQAAPKRPWAFDNVVKLHNELRAEANDTGDVMLMSPPKAAGNVALARMPMPPATEPEFSASPTADAPIIIEEPHHTEAYDEAGPVRASIPEPLQAPIVTRGRDSARVIETSAALDDEQTESAGPTRNRWLVVGAVLLAIAAVAFYVQMESRVSEASRRAAAAERGVSETREAAREQLAEMARAADSRIATAQQAAKAAQMVASIVAAPDVQRFELTGRGPAQSASGQMLWSREQGLSVTLNGMPPAAEGSHYHVWLDGPSSTVSLGPIVADSEGRVQLLLTPTSEFPRTLVGVRVTIEPPTGSPRPSGPIVVVSRPAFAQAPS